MNLFERLADAIYVGSVLLFVFGGVGAVCALVAEWIDRLESTRAMRDAARREAEEAEQQAIVRRRMHGWVPR